MTSLDILESSYCVDYSMQSSNDLKLSLASPHLPLPTQVISSPSCPPPLSYYESNPKAKDQLIQKATARLRCRLLQEGLTDVQSKVAQLRSQLDDLRIELSTTENVLSKFGEPDNRQLQALERRFNTHQQQLDHVLSTSMLLPIPTPTTPPIPNSSLSAKAITTSVSLSSTLSRMSSIFTSSRRQKPTKKRPDSAEVPPVPELILNSNQCSDYSSTSSSSTSEEGDNDMATPSVQEAREKRIRRRQRVRQLRREYQKRLRCYDPTWNEDGDWHSARSPSAPSVDSALLHSQPSTTPTCTSTSPPPSQQQRSQLAQEQSQNTQPQSSITLSPTNEMTNIHPTTERKRSTSKKTSATATPSATIAKKTVTTSTAPTQAKPTPVQCLCKRKSTNKPSPVRHHKAASVISQTYHSKQPEWAVFKDKSPEEHSPSANQTAPSTLMADQVPAHHSTAKSSEDGPPPSQADVSGWLFDQQRLHLQQQQQHHDNDDDGGDKIDIPCTTQMDQHSAYQQTSSVSATKSDQTGQHQQALNLFDDVLNYLDTFSDFGSDAGLQQDISLLLSTFNKNEDDLQSTYSSSTSSSYWSHHHHVLSSSSSAFYQQLQLYTILVNHGMATFSQYIVECVTKGLSWCKFLSVLSLACLISLGRGPENMLLSLDDLDYLDLLSDQDEFVDSYYL